MDTNFYMAGTEKTGKYTVIANGTEARVGVRNLGGAFRVRVEPTKEVLNSYSRTKAMHEHLGDDWKYPNGQPRFSVVVSEDDLGDALTDAREVVGGLVAVNPACPDFLRVPFGLAPMTPEPVAAPAAKTCGLNEDLVKALTAATQAIAAALASQK